MRGGPLKFDMEVDSAQSDWNWSNCYSAKVWRLASANFEFCVKLSITQLDANSGRIAALPVSLPFSWPAHIGKLTGAVDSIARGLLSLSFSVPLFTCVAKAVVFYTVASLWLSSRNSRFKRHYDRWSR